MTPDEFRAGRPSRSSTGSPTTAPALESRPVMAQTAPGEIEAQLPPARRPRQPEPFDAILRDLDSRRHAGPHALAASRASSATSRRNGALASVLGDLRQHRPRRPRPGVAVEPGADARSKKSPPTGCGRWSACRSSGAASSRTPPRPARCVALLCARERDDRATAWPRRACRPKRSRSSSTPRRTATARSRRRRCWPASAATTSASCRTTRSTRCGPTRSTRRLADRSPAGLSRAPSWPRPARPRRRRSIRWRRSPRVARRHGLWLHVDAAMAGSAMILPECRWMWEGVEQADSLVAQPAQVARRRVRLLGVLRARPRAPGARDVDQSQLPAVGGGRPA